jgi:hypothetical protein
MISGSQLLAVGAILGNEVSVGALDNWVHWEKIQAISRHATAGIFAILVFGLAGRLVAWFIPEGHARKVVIWIDDAILIAVLAGFGWELLIYVWGRHFGYVHPLRS